jgi:hypothetical protein
MKEMPESLVGLAIVVVVSGVLLPLFLKLGFGVLASSGLALGCGLFVVAALVVRVWIIDGFLAWLRPKADLRQQDGGEDTTGV